MASSSCENTEAGAKWPTPARGEKRRMTMKKKKMKVVRRRPQKPLLTSRQKWEPLAPLDEEFLRNVAALISPESGFSLDKYLLLDNMGDILKAENDLLAELGSSTNTKGFR